MQTGRTAVTFRADAVLQADRVISNSCKEFSWSALHVQETDRKIIIPKRGGEFRRHKPLSYHSPLEISESASVVRGRYSSSERA